MALKDIDPVSLARKLISIDTVGGNETECAEYLGSMLQEAGFRVKYHDFKPGRANLIADLAGSGDKPPLCFSGHLDVVPFGDAKWERCPLGGEIHDGKLFGRGASDMKSGVAAMTVAALRAAKFKNIKSGLKLIFSASEENACQGVNGLVKEPGLLGEAGALVIGEPTSNYPVIGHKGALWIKIRTKGKTAHGSMPEKGVNAIYKMADVIAKLRNYKFKCQADPVLGNPTLNLGKIEGGINYNLVPDASVIYVDIRTVPELSHEDLLDDMKEYLGADALISIETDAKGVASSPEDPWVNDVYKITREYTGEDPVPRGATYFTDASALAGFYKKPPVILLGPGEPAMCHQTDEFCYAEKIIEATEVYAKIAENWTCG